MNKLMWPGLATAAVMIAATLWACDAPDVPDPGESELWNQVHGGGHQPVAHEKSAPVQVAPHKDWKGEVVFSELSKDLGDVKRGDPASHKYTITNKTNQVLHIKNVRGS